MSNATGHQRSWRASVLILAVTTAVAVSVIYLPQPLLTDVARAFGVSTGAAGIVATTVQLGYAVGIFFLVPLADRVDPRRQITLQMLVLVAALAATAILPTVGSVACGFLAVGLVANIAQLIIPVAGRLAPDSRKQSTILALVSSLLIGIFGGRIVASLLAGVIGWRGVVLVFAALVLVMVPLVRSVLPQGSGATNRQPYPRLLTATLVRFVRSPQLRQSSIMQFLGFAVFNSIWTVMVLHLTGPLFGWTVPEAGLFGVVGLAAGVVTPFAGRWMERFGVQRVTGAFLVVLVLATASIVLDAANIWLFSVSMFLLTWANQVLQSANQSRALQSNPDGPAQANTVFMVSVFFGGTLGAVVGPLAFQVGGMQAVAAVGIVLALLFAVVWVLSLRTERAAAQVAV